MGKRYALLLGIHEIDQSHYDDNEYMFAAEGSVDKFRKYFQKEKFDKIFFEEDNTNRTSNWLVRNLTRLRREMKEGDLLVIYFCGHTYRLTNKFSKDGLLYTNRSEQGWVLYDRVFFHFELWEQLKDMSEGVRIVVFADTCYGDMLDIPYGRAEKDNFLRYLKDVRGIQPKLNKKQMDLFKAQSTSTGVRCFRQDVGLYNTILLRAEGSHSHIVKPSVVIISASDRNSASIPGFGARGEATPFAEFFERSVQHSVSPKNLSKLFQRMVSHFYDAYKFDDDPNDDKRKAIPQWHYQQGEMYTKLRTQVPLFKSENF